MDEWLPPPLFSFPFSYPLSRGGPGSFFKKEISPPSMRECLILGLFLLPFPKKDEDSSAKELFSTPRR